MQNGYHLMIYQLLIEKQFLQLWTVIYEQKKYQVELIMKHH